MFAALFGGARQRLEKEFARAARAAPSGPLAAYYGAGLADLEAPAGEARLLAIDLETDGLRPADDSILEAGMVELECGTVAVATARRFRFRADAALNPQAVVIHRITDDDLSDALPTEEALARVLQACAGRVLVAHFAEIEAGFLDAACRRVFGAPFVAPFICTMQIENRWFPRPRAEDGLRLGKLRSQYGLPAYRAHDGLTDALACAELLLAQIAHAGRAQVPVGQMLRH